MYNIISFLHRFIWIPVEKLVSLKLLYYGMGGRLMVAAIPCDTRCFGGLCSLQRTAMCRGLLVGVCVCLPVCVCDSQQGGYCPGSGVHRGGVIEIKHNVNLCPAAHLDLLVLRDLAL